jgi:hypothetical protein
MHKTLLSWSLLLTAALVVVAALMTSGIVGAQNFAGQERAQPCVGYRYTVTKAIPHPGVAASATVCATFTVMPLFGEDYDRFHFEKALKDGGFTFAAPVWGGR